MNIPNFASRHHVLRCSRDGSAALPGAATAARPPLDTTLQSMKMPSQAGNLLLLIAASLLRNFRFPVDIRASSSTLHLPESIVEDSALTMFARRQVVHPRSSGRPGGTFDSGPALQRGAEMRPRPVPEGRYES